MGIGTACSSGVLKRVRQWWPFAQPPLYKNASLCSFSVFVRFEKVRADFGFLHPVFICVQPAQYMLTLSLSH